MVHYMVHHAVHHTVHCMVHHMVHHAVHHMAHYMAHSMAHSMDLLPHSLAGAFRQAGRGGARRPDPARPGRGRAGHLRRQPYEGAGSALHSIT